MVASLQPFPQRISFGSGCAVSCADEFAARQVQRVLLLTSPSVAPHAKPVVEALMARNMVVTTRSDLKPVPTAASFASLLTAVRGFCPEGIIGFGGGGVLDTAKLLACLHELPEEVRNFYGGELIPRRKTILACMPTTLGAGAELSARVLLADDQAGHEQVISSRWLAPDFLFVDPLYTLTLPPATTAAASVAALGSCLEARASSPDFPLTLAYAESGLRLISQSLTATIKNGLNARARSTMALGNLQAALAVQAADSVMSQVLAGPLSRTLALPRTLAAALLVLPLARWRLETDPGLYAGLASSLESGSRRPAAAAKTPGFLEKLTSLVEKSGLSAQRRRLSCPESTIQTLARAASADPRLQRQGRCNLSLDTLERLYREATAA